jgi:hypothetical protein
MRSSPFSLGYPRHIGRQRRDIHSLGTQFPVAGWIALTAAMWVAWLSSDSR